MRKQLTLTQLKLIAIGLAMASAFYPVFELSRCIIRYNIIGGWQPGWQGAYLADFYAELGFMWFFYLVILPLLINWVIGLAARWGRRHA
jgi:hypothetical protein